MRRSLSSFLMEEQNIFYDNLTAPLLCRRKGMRMKNILVRIFCGIIRGFTKRTSLEKMDLLVFSVSRNCKIMYVHIIIYLLIARAFSRKPFQANNCTTKKPYEFSHVLKINDTYVGDLLQM